MNENNNLNSLNFQKISYILQVIVAILLLFIYVWLKNNRLLYFVVLGFICVTGLFPSLAGKVSKNTRNWLYAIMIPYVFSVFL